MGSLSAGDTVWIAGGNYGSQGMNWSKGGANGNPIKFYRVQAADAAPSSAAGWNSSFDSQVVTAGNFAANPGPGNITLDGRVNDGIKITTVNGNNTAMLLNGGNNYTISHVTFIGPGWGRSGGYGINWIDGSGHLCDHVKFDGVNQQLSWSVSAGIVQYCTFMNAGPGTSSYHSDMIYCGGMSNSTFRYNYFYNSWSQAFFWDNGGSGTVYIYGNVADQGPNGTGVFLETKQGYKWGDFHVYNNTFLGWSTAAVQVRGTAPSNQEIKNNIFLNTTWLVDSGTTSPASDYNGYNTKIPSAEGSHSMSSTTVPVVNMSDSSVAAANFQLVANSWPINKGTALTTDSFINYDMNRNQRGADGAWDIGAFEYGAGAGPTPMPPTNLRVAAKCRRPSLA